ncbi:hypothetical protein B566_EDAN015131 [Ephemera danica]|nr:hypothetical protein B566_EDAN015131 [Ephemera danica]
MQWAVRRDTLPCNRIIKASEAGRVRGLRRRLWGEERQSLTGHRCEKNICFCSDNTGAQANHNFGGCRRIVVVAGLNSQFVNTYTKPCPKYAIGMLLAVKLGYAMVITCLLLMSWAILLGATPLPGAGSSLLPNYAYSLGAVQVRVVILCVSHEFKD